MPGCWQRSTRLTICAPTEAQTWIDLPDTPSAKLHLMARAELAPASPFGAPRLR